MNDFACKQELLDYRFLEPLVYIWECARQGWENTVNMSEARVGRTVEWECSSGSLILRCWIYDIREIGIHDIDERT